MHLLKVLPLLLLLVGCQDDDDNAREFCLDPEALINCNDLKSLSVQEHFDALLGDWMLVYEVSAGANGPVVERCGPEITTGSVLGFKADSTYYSVDGDIVFSGRWSIVTASTPEEIDITRLETDNGIFFDPIGSTCDNDFVFSDSRPLDGSYRLYRRL
jgi:hypothetical protein